MGATNIHVIQKGPDMMSAFRSAQAEAKDEYGHQQGYSGAINSCQFGSDKTSKYKELGEEAFEEWALDNMDKGDVAAYDKGDGSYGFVGWAPC